MRILSCHDDLQRIGNIFRSVHHYTAKYFIWRLLLLWEISRIQSALLGELCRCPFCTHLIVTKTIATWACREHTASISEMVDNQPIGPAERSARRQGSAVEVNVVRHHGELSMPARLSWIGFAPVDEANVSRSVWWNHDITTQNRIVKVWNELPASTDFSTLRRFRNSIHKLHLARYCNEL